MDDKIFQITPTYSLSIFSKLKPQIFFKRLNQPSQDIIDQDNKDITAKSGFNPTQCSVTAGKT